MQRIRHPASSTNGIIWISTKMSVVAANNDDRPVASDTPQMLTMLPRRRGSSLSVSGHSAGQSDSPKTAESGRFWGTAARLRLEDPAHFSCVLASLGKTQLPDAVRTKRVTSSAPSDDGRCF